MNLEYDPIADNYKSYITSRPHVVILGAGATIVAIPNGDKNDLKCSVMSGFIDNLGLRKTLSGISLETKSENLEDIYSELYGRPEYLNTCKELEDKIIAKFSSLEIPDTPTVYDYLLLSLRSKDFIFSFNLEDLILQAYQRACDITHDLPQLVFLHGNIGVGKCSKCGSIEALRNKKCRKCGHSLMRPKILFPVRQKDYGSDEYIKNCWDGFLDILGNATVVTIFGYSAPKSDTLAINAMKKAFGSSFRRLDQIEVVDIKSEDELWDTWSDFIKPTNDHFKVCRTIFDSILAEFPRRSIEGYYKRNFSNWWGRSKISLKNSMSFDDLASLLSPLILDEGKQKFEVVV